MKNKASSGSTSKKKTPRPTSEELEEAGKGLHSLSDAVQRKIEYRGIPNDYEIGVLAAKFSHVNLNSGNVASLVVLVIGSREKKHSY